MSIIPKQQPVPEGVNTATTLARLQDVTEASVKDLIRTQHTTGPQHVAEGLHGMLTGIGQALRGIFDPASWFASIGRAGQDYRDGQEALTRRTDLLSPLLDYGSAYMGNLSGFDVTGVMPFRTQIGPMRGCHLDADGIRLEDKGLWDIRAQLTAETVFIVTGRMEWRVVVKNPQGGIYSIQRATVTSSSRLTQTLVSSVVVPEPGYLVQVELTSLGVGRTILGGPAWNRLVVQHISRGEDGATGAEESQTPPDPIQGPRPTEIQ